MDPEILITEARARIIWGDPPESVRSFLTCNGMSEPEADAKTKELKHERNNEIRKMGLRDTLVGVAALAVAGISIFAILTSSRTSISVGRSRGLGAVILGACYGLGKLVKGIINLTWPQSEHESIPDMSD